MNQITRNCGVVFLLLLGFVLFSCTGGKLPRDMVFYINTELHNISQLENLALTHYAAVTGENYTDDQKVYHALKENVIPYYQRFFELLKEIRPENPEIRKIHSAYISGASDIYNGFKAKMIGLEVGDRVLVRMANEQIESGARKVDQWRVELATLIAQNKSVRLK